MNGNNRPDQSFCKQCGTQVVWPERNVKTSYISFTCGYGEKTEEYNDKTLMIAVREMRQVGRETYKIQSQVTIESYALFCNYNCFYKHITVNSMIDKINKSI